MLQILHSEDVLVQFLRVAKCRFPFYSRIKKGEGDKVITILIYFIYFFVPTIYFFYHVASKSVIIWNLEPI